MKVRTRVSIDIEAPRERAFDISVDPERMPQLFRGFGPIPGMKKLEVDGEHATGATRRIHNEDGSIIEELVVEITRPKTHRYRIVSGLEPPFSKLVSGGEGHWSFEHIDRGTRVTWRFAFELSTRAALPIALPIVKGFFRKAQANCLKELKQAAERGSLP